MNKGWRDVRCYDHLVGSCEIQGTDPLSGTSIHSFAPLPLLVHSAARSAFVLELYFPQLSTVTVRKHTRPFPVYFSRAFFFTFKPDQRPRVLLLTLGVSIEPSCFFYRQSVHRTH